MSASTRRLTTSCLVLLTTFSYVAHTAHAAGCSVDVNSAAMPKPQPVMVTASTSQGYSSFLKPNGKGFLLPSQGQQVTLACPGTSFLIVKENAGTVHASCEDETLFRVEGGTKYTLNVLACSATVTPTLRFTGASCGFRNSYGVAEVGFIVEKGFYQLYDVCFSNKSLAAAYAHHIISADVGGAQTVSDTRKWVDGSVFGKVVVEDAYLKQNETLKTMGVNATVYITDDVYLERGALAPAADFLLESHHAAAFFGVNSAPRWTPVGTGNWKTLEDSLRGVATYRNRDLDVYTGTHGVLALPNSKGVAMQIHLSEKGGKKVLPVPRYLWKIVYEPVSGLGAAFITVNNPFASKEELEARYRLCSDICDKIDWLKWDQQNGTAGMSYCCDYLEFKKKVPNAPTVDIKMYSTPSGATDLAVLWLPLILTTLASIWNVVSVV